MRLFLCLVFIGIASFSWSNSQQSAASDAGGPRSKWDRRGYQQVVAHRRVHKPKFTKEERQERRLGRKKKRLKRRYKLFQKETNQWRSFSITKFLKWSLVYGIIGVVVRWSVSVFPYYVGYYLFLLIIAFCYWRIRRPIWRKRVEKYDLEEEA